MKYYKIVSDGYILAIGTGAGGEEITEAEYNSLMATIQNRPKADPGWGYRLNVDLAWEKYEIPVEEDPDLDDSEALALIVGGDANA